MNTKNIFTLTLIICLQSPLMGSYAFDDFSTNGFDNLSKEGAPFEQVNFEFSGPQRKKLATEEQDGNDNDEIMSASPTMALSNESALTKDAQKNPDLFGPADEKKDVFLNFENADLKSFVEYIADIKSMNIIPDKTIAGNKISLNFRNPVSKTGAWNTFLTVLEMANLSIVKVGSLYRVISKDKKFRQPLPTFIGVDPKTLPDSDATIRYIALLDNLAASEVKDMLQSMLSQGATVMTPANINGFIITDCSCVIKAAMQVLDELDQTGVEECVYVMQLKRANAPDIKTLFDSLITSKDVNPLAKLLGKPQDTSEYFTPGTRLIPEERTNKLILMGQRQSLEKIKNFITEHLDTELKQAKSPLRIYNLQNANASDMVAILKSATDSSQSSTVGKQAAAYGAIRDGVKYFKNMTFQADKDSNRLLVSCADDNDWLLIKETIKKLDTAQPQVAMQMLIVSISAASVLQLGGQARSPNQNSIGGGVSGQTAGIYQTAFTTDSSGNTQSILGNVLNTIALSSGSSVVALGNAASSNGVWGVFNAIKTETDATVLSQPFAVAANCTETKLVVGSTAYIQTQTTGGSGPISGLSPANANTTVTFTPQVNSEGVIRLKITTDITDFVPESGNLATTTKNLNSTVTVANGQVLVIGGFIQTKVTDSGGQTPLFGSIPILGWLAKNLNRQVTKSYIFLFLCPTILKPRTTPGIGTYSKMALHQAAKEVEQTIQTTKTNDPIHNWLFNSTGENYSHKVIDFANARYQPNNVDIRFDPYYQSQTADTIKQQPALKLNTPPASPQEYARELKKEAEAEIETKKKTIEQKKAKPNLKNSYKKETHVPEKVTLKEPEITVESTEEEPLPKALNPSTSEQEKVSVGLPATTDVAMFDVDTALAEKRTKLRSLLAQGSLSDLLTASPHIDPIKEMSPEEYESTYGEPQQQTPDSQDRFMLSRRTGIRNLFATGEQPATIVPTSQRASSGLQSLLGGK